MRVTYLTGQNPESFDLGPILVPVGAGSLPQGVEGQVIGYGVNGALVAVDAPAGGSIYDDAPLTERVVALEGAPAPTWGAGKRQAHPVPAGRSCSPDHGRFWAFERTGWEG